MSPSPQVLLHLAEQWEAEALMTDASQRQRHEALRECAEHLRLTIKSIAAIPDSCPHSAPFRFCDECAVSPCPIGLGGHAK